MGPPQQQQGEVGPAAGWPLEHQISPGQPVRQGCSHLPTSTPLYLAHLPQAPLASNYLLYPGPTRQQLFATLLHGPLKKNTPSPPPPPPTCCRAPPTSLRRMPRTRWRVAVSPSGLSRSTRTSREGGCCSRVAPEGGGEGAEGRGEGRVHGRGDIYPGGMVSRKGRGQRKGKAARGEAAGW